MVSAGRRSSWVATYLEPNSLQQQAGRRGCTALLTLRPHILLVSRTNYAFPNAADDTWLTLVTVFWVLLAQLTYLRTPVHTS